MNLSQYLCVKLVFSFEGLKNIFFCNEQNFILFIGFFYFFHAQGQNKKVLDSLDVAYIQAKHDTSKILTLIQIASEYYKTNKDTSLTLSFKIIELSNKIQFYNGIANAAAQIEVIYRGQDQYIKALEYANIALKNYEKTKDTKNIAQMYLSFGILYDFLGNYPTTVDYFLKSLKIRQEIKDKQGIGQSYNSLGVIYQKMQNYDKALTYFNDCLKIGEEIKSDVLIATANNNIGINQRIQKKNDKALIYYQKALAIRQKMGEKRSIAATYNNIGTTYWQMDSLDLAKEYFEKSIKIKEEINDKQGIIQSFSGLSDVYKSKKDFPKSLDYAQKTYKLSEDLKMLREIKNSAEKLYKLYREMNDFENAIIFLELNKKLEDSLFGVEKTKAISNLESKADLEKKEQENMLLLREKELLNTSLLVNELEAESKQRQLEIYEKQTEAESLLFLARTEKDKRKADSLMNLAQKATLEADNLKIKDEKMKAEIEKHTAVRNGFIAGFVLLFFIAALILFFFIAKRKANKLLESQKNIIEKSNHDLELLGEIGKNITESLEIKQIIQTVYGHVNGLMQLDGFGIGIYNEKDQTLDFDGYIENGQELEFCKDALNNSRLISAACFNRQTEILITNLPLEHKHYVSEYGFVAGAIDIKSLIYLPLNSEHKKVGVITVQSFNLNAYQENHVSLLHHIANYTASAIQKAEAYHHILSLNENLEMQKQTIEATYEKLQKTAAQLDKSIQYASHIQSIVMPQNDDLKHFFTDLFVIFRPKDVVSGDFYWFSQISEDLAIFSLADCTGHGVPGAFMSMLGSTILHETVNVNKIHDNPALILKNLHENVRVILKQNEKKNNDGMDIALCVFRKNRKDKNIELTFAGAKSTMSYVINGEIFDLKGDKQYLGGNELRHEFTNHFLVLPEETAFYLYTDGYQDQQNSQRKRIGSTTFREMLAAVANDDFQMQKTHLENALDAHQNKEEQRDDISVLGFSLANKQKITIS